MSQRPRDISSNSANGRPPSPRATGGRLRMLAFFMLIGLLAIAIVGRMALEQRLAFRPTPTITRPASNTETPTPDFRATQNIIEIITQSAYRSAQTGITTPTRDVTITPTATTTPEESSPTAPPTRTVLVQLPDVSSGGNPTATPLPTVTPTAGGISVQTPTPEPGGATQTAVAGITATALLFTPTSTDTPVPTATPTQPVVGAPPVATLQAVTKAQIKIYAGPSVLYAFKTELPENLTVRLEGRTTSGEWIHVCCVNDVDGWTRQANVNLVGNQPPTGAPADAKGDDVRWLALQQTNEQPLTPIPTATEIASTDYPLFRRDSGATAHVTARFIPPFQDGWPSNSQSTAARGFSSPPVVVGSLVIAASDDSHLYSFDKTIGNQRWKINLNAIVTHTPAIQGAYIYLFDDSGTISALRDTGSPADAFVWQIQLGAVPRAALNVQGNLLFAVGQNHSLYALNRLDNGQIRWRFAAPEGLGLQYPAIGDQMIYVGDARLSALDVYSGTVVWEDSIVSGVAAPLVYSRPGVNGLAEVYAVDFAGVIHALDANTGAAFWRKASTISPNDRPTALAIDERTLYATGLGFVSARDRRTGNEMWRISFDGAGVPGGPIVGNGRLLVAGLSGSVQILDAATGQVVGSVPIIEPLSGPPAVSDGWIYLAARNGRLYAMRESN